MPFWILLRNLPISLDTSRVFIDLTSVRALDSSLLFEVGVSSKIATRARALEPVVDGSIKKPVPYPGYEPRFVNVGLVSGFKPIGTGFGLALCDRAAFGICVVMVEYMNAKTSKDLAVLESNLQDGRFEM